MAVMGLHYLLLLWVTVVLGNPCANRTLESLPHLSNCQAFVLCWMSRAFLQSCPYDFYFDMMTNKCQPGAMMPCFMPFRIPLPPIPDNEIQITTRHGPTTPKTNLPTLSTQIKSSTTDSLITDENRLTTVEIFTPEGNRSTPGDKNTTSVEKQSQITLSPLTTFRTSTSVATGTKEISTLATGTTTLGPITSTSPVDHYTITDSNFDITLTKSEQSSVTAGTVKSTEIITTTPQELKPTRHTMPTIISQTTALPDSTTNITDSNIVLNVTVKTKTTESSTSTITPIILTENSVTEIVTDKIVTDKTKEKTNTVTKYDHTISHMTTSREITTEAVSVTINTQEILEITPTEAPSKKTTEVVTEETEQTTPKEITIASTAEITGKIITKTPETTVTERELTKPELKTETEVESTRTPGSEPVTKIKPATEPVDQPVTEVNPATESGSEIVLEAIPATEYEPQPVTKAKPVTEPSSEPVTETKLVTEPRSEPVTEAKPATEPITEANPATEHKLEPVSEIKSATEPGSMPVIEAKPATESGSVPETETKSKTEPRTEVVTKTTPMTELVTETKPAIESGSEPVTEAKPVTEITISITDELNIATENITSLIIDTSRTTVEHVTTESVIVCDSCKTTTSNIITSTSFPDKNTSITTKETKEPLAKVTDHTESVTATELTSSTKIATHTTSSPTKTEIIITLKPTETPKNCNLSSPTTEKCNNLSSATTEKKSITANENTTTSSTNISTTVTETSSCDGANTSEETCKALPTSTTEYSYLQTESTKSTNSELPPSVTDLSTTSRCNGCTVTQQPVITIVSTSKESTEVVSQETDSYLTETSATEVATEIELVTKTETVTEPKLVREKERFTEPELVTEVNSVTETKPTTEHELATSFAAKSTSVTTKNSEAPLANVTDHTESVTAIKLTTSSTEIETHPTSPATNTETIATLKPTEMLENCNLSSPTTEICNLSSATTDIISTTPITTSVPTDIVSSTNITTNKKSTSNSTKISTIVTETRSCNDANISKETCTTLPLSTTEYSPLQNESTKSTNSELPPNVSNLSTTSPCNNGCTISIPTSPIIIPIISTNKPVTEIVTNQTATEETKVTTEAVTKESIQTTLHTATPREITAKTISFTVNTQEIPVTETEGIEPLITTELTPKELTKVVIKEAKQTTPRDMMTEPIVTVTSIETTKESDIVVTETTTETTTEIKPVTEPNTVTNQKLVTEIVRVTETEPITEYKSTKNENVVVTKKKEQRTQAELTTATTACPETASVTGSEPITEPELVTGTAVSEPGIEQDSELRSKTEEPQILNTEQNKEATTAITKDTEQTTLISQDVHQITLTPHVTEPHFTTTATETTLTTIIGPSSTASTSGSPTRRTLPTVPVTDSPCDILWQQVQKFRNKEVSSLNSSPTTSTSRVTSIAPWITTRRPAITTSRPQVTTRTSWHHLSTPFDRNRSHPLPMCRLRDEFVYPDLNDCSFYYKCFYGMMARMKCVYGYEFNTRSLKCMPRLEANCRRYRTYEEEKEYLDVFIQNNNLARRNMDI